jgi:uncharacterized membrane protein
VWLVQFTFLGGILQLEKLPLGIMEIIAGYVVIYLVLVEFVKRIFYKRQRQRMEMEKIEAKDGTVSA